MHRLFVTLILISTISANGHPTNVSGTNRNIFGTLADALEKMVDGYRSVVAENFSDKNLKYEYDPVLGEGGKLRNLDWRLPHLAKVVPRRQNYPAGRVEVHPGVWKFYSTIVNHYDNNNGSQRLARKYQKLQDEIPPNVSFPCSVENGRSKTRPVSADQLRPGDIDLIAALGDSLVAGTGLAATNLLQAAFQNSGLSWGIGGLGNWRKYLTLPNILKVFNPKLVGYSTIDTIWNGRYDSSDYNLAVPSAIDDDLLTMAKTFVAKAQMDPAINFKDDWKLITIFQGGNNICSDYCYWKKPSDAATHHRRVTEEALDYLMMNSPRTIVNFVILPNFVRILLSESRKSSSCTMLSHWLCSCLFSDTFQQNAGKYAELIDDVIQAQRDAANNPRYQQRIDFAVVEQPVLVNVTNLDKNTKSGKSTDYRLLSADCIHFSQRLGALVSNAIWNSMLRPFGSKPQQANLTLFQTFDCPTKNRPFIATHRNS